MLPTSTARRAFPPAPPPAHHPATSPRRDDRLARLGLQAQEPGRDRGRGTGRSPPRRCGGWSARSPGRWSDASSHARTSSDHRGARELAVEPVEQRLEDGARATKRPAGLLFERRGVRRRPERRPCPRTLMPIPTRDVRLVALRPRLGDDPGELAAAAVEIVRPLQRRRRPRSPRAGPRASSARAAIGTSESGSPSADAAAGSVR